MVVYVAKEHADLKECSGAAWDSLLMKSAHKAKFFGLLPF